MVENKTKPVLGPFCWYGGGPVQRGKKLFHFWTEKRNQKWTFCRSEEFLNPTCRCATSSVNSSRSAPPPTVPHPPSVERLLPLWWGFGGWFGWKQGGSVLILLRRPDGTLGRDRSGPAPRPVATHPPSSVGVLAEGLAGGRVAGHPGRKGCRSLRCSLSTIQTSHGRRSDTVTPKPQPLVPAQSLSHEP